MSQLSLDSLDDCANSDDKVFTDLTKVDRSTSTTYDNVEAFEEYRGVSDPCFLHRTTCDNVWKDTEFNERTIAESVNSTKFRGNALIASNTERFGKSRLSEKKLAPKLEATPDFRAETPRQKKFDVARRSSSFSSTSTSLPEFRHRVSQQPSKNGPDDIGGSVKTGKKLGKPRRVVVDTEKKKFVSYLELHRRKFGVATRRCIQTPEGPTSSICDDRSDECLGHVHDEASFAVSRDNDKAVGHRRRTTKLVSPRPRETRSCEASNRYETYDGVVTEANRCDVFESFRDVVRSVEPRKRIPYKPYSIEDYKCLTVPQPDRSLGPDRIEMESKAEWLMRRRSYGDSVSSRNRQRILLRAQKLKESRRAGVEKLRLPPLTDVENPVPASKVDDKEENIGINVRVKRPIRSKSVQTRQMDESASGIGKLPSVVLGRKSALSRSKPNAKATSAFSDLYEMSSDEAEDAMRLRNLQLRHLEEKKRIDRIFKRGLCA